MGTLNDGIDWNELVLGLFDRYMEALPDEYSTAKYFMREFLANTIKMMNIEELFLTLISNWDHNLMGSVLSDLDIGSPIPNQIPANPHMRKETEKIQNLVSVTFTVALTGKKQLLFS